MSLQVHNPRALVEHLCALPRETEWVEFKENKFSEDSVGKYVSALANSAMLERKDFAYLVYGVRDEDHSIVGTTVDLLGKSIGSEPFVLWLNKYLEPHINIQIEQVDFSGRRVEIICIEPNYQQPVRLKKIPYVRIGSSQQPLSNYPDRERDLWSITYRHSFEDCFIGRRYAIEEIGEHFTYPVLLRRLGEKNEAPNALR